MIAGLSEKLRMERARKKLSQQDVADRIGISRNSVSQYELDTNVPPADILMKLAGVYGVSVDYLLGMDKIPRISVEGLLPDQIQELEDTRDYFLRKNKIKAE